MKYLLLLNLFTASNFLFGFSPADSLNQMQKEPNRSGNITTAEAKRNLFYAQFLGDTPTFGIGYRRVFIEKIAFSVELGLGLGFMPHVFNQRINPKPSNLIYSHSIVIVRKNDKFIKPFIGYSGIMYSGIFYKGKMYNYIPSPNIGVRLGKGDDLNFNVSWFGHVYKKDVQTLQGESTLQTVRKSYILSIPAFGIQLKF